MLGGERAEVERLLGASRLDAAQLFPGLALSERNQRGLNLYGACPFDDGSKRSDPHPCGYILMELIQQHLQHLPRGRKWSGISLIASQHREILQLQQVHRYIHPDSRLSRHAV